MPKKPLPPTGEIILYPTEDGHSRVECRFSGETVWLTQVLLAELYQKDVRTINEHLQNLFEEGELDPEATIRKFRTVRREGQREVARLIEHYNLALASDYDPGKKETAGFFQTIQNKLHFASTAQTAPS